MKDIFKYIEEILVDLWNKLYVLLCDVWDEEVDEDLFLKPTVLD